MTLPEKKSAIESLAATCEAIAKGHFEEVEDLFDMVSDAAVPEDIRGLAEIFAGMVVQIEAREFHRATSPPQEWRRGAPAARVSDLLQG